MATTGIAMRRSLICWQGLPRVTNPKKTAQHNALTDHCGGDGMRDKSEGKLPVLPMVYSSK